MPTPELETLSIALPVNFLPSTTDSGPVTIATTTIDAAVTTPSASGLPNEPAPVVLITQAAPIAEPSLIDRLRGVPAALEAETGVNGGLVTFGISAVLIMTALRIFRK